MTRTILAHEREVVDYCTDNADDGRYDDDSLRERHGLPLQVLERRLVIIVFRLGLGLGFGFGFGLGLDRRIGNRLACGLGRNSFLGRRFAFGLRGRRRCRLACAGHDDDVLVIGSRNRNVLEAFAFRHRRPPGPC